MIVRVKKNVSYLFCFVTLFIRLNNLLILVHKLGGIGTAQLKEEYSTIAVGVEHCVIDLIPTIDITLANHTVVILARAENGVVYMNCAQSWTNLLKEVNYILAYTVGVANIVCNPGIIYAVDSCSQLRRCRAKTAYKIFNAESYAELCGYGYHLLKRLAGLLYRLAARR